MSSIKAITVNVTQVDHFSYRKSSSLKLHSIYFKARVNLPRCYESTKLSCDNAALLSRACAVAHSLAIQGSCHFHTLTLLLQFSKLVSQTY